MRRSHLVLAVILVAVVVLCLSLWVNEGPLWRLVMLKRVDFDSRITRGWETVKRWTDPPVQHGKIVHYYKKTGMKTMEGERHGRVFSQTSWNLDGTIRQQLRVDPNGTLEDKRTPPWWWGVKDQTEPTAPWWNEKQRQ